jgi:hypothetical protein
LGLGVQNLGFGAWGSGFRGWGLDHEEIGEGLELRERWRVAYHPAGGVSSVYKDGIRRPTQTFFGLKNSFTYLKCRHCLAYGVSGQGLGLKICGLRCGVWVSRPGI